MKVKRYIYILMIHMIFASVAGAQAVNKTELDNGRAPGVLPKIKVEETGSPQRPVDNYRGGSDTDDGMIRKKGQDMNEWTMPHDLDLLLDMMDTDKRSELSALKNQIKELIYQNRLMKEQMSELYSNFAICCDNISNSESAPEFETYLLQSMPNPTVSNARISFNIPGAFNNASIRFMDMMGRIVKSYPISEPGFNTVEIEGHDFSPGSYIYTLIVDGKAVESKVMNVAQ